MDVGTGSPTAPLGTIQVQATGSSDAVPDATFLTRQGPGSVLFGMGAIDGNLINGGILRSYKATVAGSFQQTSSGTLAMQILGLNRNVTLDSTLGEHDWLDATGDVTLGGTACEQLLRTAIYEALHDLADRAEQAIAELEAERGQS